MFALAFYLLKVTICSGILFGYYWFMLRNKIFHQYNRFYLLAAVLLSLALPLIQINIWHNAGQPAPQGIKLLQVVNSSEYLDGIVIMAKRTSFTTEQALLLFYSITTFVFLCLFIQALINIRTLLIKHRHTFIENVFFVNTTAKGTPFSFLKYIFWNDHIDPESPTGHQIFKHELAHVRQKHSYDKLLLNAALIFFWCNPFFWLIRKELNMIHEFMADKIAVEDSDTEAFAAMILQATYPQHRFNLANSFFFSPIKRRLMMLTKNKHSKVGYIGRLMVLPLAVLVFAAFTLKAKTFKPGNQGYHGKTITVVIDAGHGGSDKGAQSIAGDIAEKDLTLAISKRIKALNGNANINIVLARETDISQSVQEKADFTQAQKADLFISIHIDATTSDSANMKTGMSVWVAKDNYANSNGSKLFASAIISEFANNYKLPVIGLPMQRQIGIKVLQESPCPSVLIEAGYITNEKDLAYLQSEDGKESIAKNVLAAIERYAFAKQNGENLNSIPPTASNKNFIGDKKADTMPEITLKNYQKALIIVDGKTISNDELKKVNPESIESVRVIKNKEGIAEYGEKGKNGVVIITTKENTLVFNDFTLTLPEGDSSITNQIDQLKIKANDENLVLSGQLIVIDGKIQSNKFDPHSISPNEIESINVLKDKKAIEKYGAKAGKGVIEITTKSKKPLIETTRSGVPNSNEVIFVAHTVIKNIKLQEPIFTKVEYEPSFPGGDTAWKNYLIKNLKSNIPVLEGWKTGAYKIVVSFMVNKDGSLADIKTNDYAGSKTAEHCIELIRKSPRWEPAILNGRQVNCYKKLPFTFIVDNP